MTLHPVAGQPRVVLLKPLITSPEACHTGLFDPILDEWMVIVNHRQTRTFLSPGDQCQPRTPRPGLASEIPSQHYDVVALEIRFPSLLPVDPVGVLILHQQGVWRCGVVCLYDWPGSYPASWHQAPVRIYHGPVGRDLEPLFVMRRPGNGKHIPASEVRRGVFIGDVMPEAVATRSRGDGA
jgi:hypothetical protein